MPEGLGFTPGRSFPGTTGEGCGAVLPSISPDWDTSLPSSVRMLTLPTPPDLKPLPHGLLLFGNNLWL